MKKGLLVFCVNHNHSMMPTNFFWSYLRMMKPNGSLAVQGSASVKASSINDGIYQALQLGAEWMFLMDADQLFPTHTIPRLLETAQKHDAKIVSVLYHIGYAPYSPVAGWTKETEYKGAKQTLFVNARGEHWKSSYAKLGTGVVEVDWAGSGGLLIHRDVIDAIGWAPFADVWKEGQGIRDMGHDVNFCLRAKAKGFKIVVDTDVKSDHGKMTYVSAEWAEAFNESNMLEKMNGVLLRHAQEAGYWDTVWQTEHIKGAKRDADSAYRETFRDIAAAVPEGAQVADIGCGPGFLMEHLRTEKGAICTGYDFSAEAIEIVKSKGFDGKVADLRAYSTNGDSGQFDAVVSTHTIEHVQDDHKFVETMKSLCWPGGKVIIATPWVEEIQGHFEHVRDYSDLDMDQLMSAHFKEFEVKKNNRDYVAVGIV